MQRFCYCATSTLQYAANKAFLGWAHIRVGFSMQKYPRTQKITLGSRFAASFSYFTPLIAVARGGAMHATMFYLQRRFWILVNPPTLVGSVICDPDEPIKVASHFVARVVVFNINFPLTQGYPLVFHLKSYNEPCVLKKLIALVNKATGEGKYGSGAALRYGLSFCNIQLFLFDLI